MPRHTPHRFSYLIRLASLVAGLALATTLPAQTPSFFPLGVGNAWLYRPAPTNNALTGIRDFQSIWVHGIETIAGRDYFDVLFFGRELVLRVEPSDGSVIQYDRASSSEKPWLSPGLPVGSAFPTTIDPCATTGTITSIGRDDLVITPAGVFANVVQVKFRGPCADAGLIEQVYAPYVGLVTSIETSFAGDIKYELVYYHVGMGMGSAPEVSFTTAIDAPSYPAGGTLPARLTLHSSSLQPIHLTFPSGQSFDLKILDDKGAVVDLWSKGRAFTTIVREESFGPGEKTYGLTMPLAALPPGHYTVEGYLTTSPVTYLGRVSFEIVPGKAPQAAIHRPVRAR